MDRGFSNPYLYDLLDVDRRFGQLTRLGRLRNDRNWPVSSDIAAQANVGFRGD
jgi:hypothetical protein